MSEDEHDHHDDHHDDHEHGDDGHHEDGHHGHDDHDHHHHDLSTVGVAVVTVSSSRNVENDPAGDAIVAAFEKAGHEVAVREVLSDDYDGIQGRLDTLLSREDVDCVLTTGGTGITPDDVTIEAARPLFEKELPGFGELFRTRSHEEIGDRVIATRATAGVADGIPVFCLPGSENAATLGADIVVGQVGHLAGLAKRGEKDESEEGAKSEDESEKKAESEDESEE